jgi:hypothetical protein
MRLLWTVLWSACLAWAPQARAGEQAEGIPRIVMPGQEARAACASCGLVLPTGAPLLPQTQLPSPTELQGPQTEAPQAAAIETLSAQFGPAKPGQTVAPPETRLGNLFDLTASAKAPPPTLGPIATDEDGQLVSPQIVTPESMSHEHEVARTRMVLAHSVSQALPALAESVRRGQWSGPETTLDKPCCGDAAPKLGLLLRQLGYNIHAVEAEFHFYLLYPLSAGQLIIDPTIRQFFGGARAPPNIPTVFVGTVGQLHQLFMENAASKSTRYDMSRIYFRDAAIRDLRMRQLQDAFSSSLMPYELIPLRRFIANLVRH